ncbi:hypothetical protein [Arthrobacter zhaoguopingii]|uniref:hypothetical protein n=1 Tax=Arthrobacter zhaoguopingii TaxID=2681491 RepID=UPI00135A5FAA|nr:hypothetical protein [Arthrobacter zhaoguopingii]
MTDFPDEAPDDADGSDPDHAALSQGNQPQASVEQFINAYEEAAAEPRYVDTLKSVASEYLDREKFQLGDVIEWKVSMRNALFPSYGRPVVVVGHVENHGNSDASGRQQSADEQLEDILIGFLDGDLDFIIRRADSGRFTLFNE